MGWVSVALVPTARMHAASLSSSMEFVMAPLPRLILSPATDGAWHSLAQWSMFPDPITALVNFCRR